MMIYLHLRKFRLAGSCEPQPRDRDQIVSSLAQGRKEWMRAALSDSGQHATSAYQLLLDIAYLVPDLMEEYDPAYIDHRYQIFWSACTTSTV
jgi:hypothetical protein